MRLGGHETFYPRPGWLTKGLLYLQNNDVRVFSQVEIADSLGVGINMAKSIGWWLRATGLATRPTRNSPFALTALGRIIVGNDPYMARLGTWWLVHASTMTVKVGTSLPWFFSPGRPGRCDRATLIEALHQEISRIKGKQPSLKSVQREVALVMQTYAVPVPRPKVDPEDNLGSTFHRLGLWQHLRGSDRFERSKPTPAPPEALGLVISALVEGHFGGDDKEGIQQDISMNDDVIIRTAMILGCSREELFNLTVKGSQTLGNAVMSSKSLVGEKRIMVSTASPSQWALKFYDRERINL